MLNELYHLALILKDNGITPPDWHKDLKELPMTSKNSPCYRIEIISGASVKTIELMKSGSVRLLRKWEHNNGESFPGFNIQPLYRITDETAKKLLRKWREGKGSVDISMLRAWCAIPGAKNWDMRTDKKVNKCLGALPQDLLALCGNIPTDFYAIRRLCERAVAFGHAGSSAFFNALDLYAWNSLEKGNGALALLPLLVHEGNSIKKPETDRGSISVFMDIPDWQEYPVAHAKTIEYINTQLLLYSDSSSPREFGATDAFGQQAEELKEKMPEVKLPILGIVKLRSMFSEIPCQQRYGMIDADSYDIGKKSRRLAKSALEWLKAEKRKGETWGQIDKKEILFAYPSAELQKPMKLASCFGAIARDNNEARFSDYAKEVLECLRGISKPLMDIDLQVFSLRKMDKARTKIVFQGNYSAQRLVDGAAAWQEGCANIPEIHIISRASKKGDKSTTSMEPPFPLQASECINFAWSRASNSSKVNRKAISKILKGSNVVTIPKTVGIELLLDESTATRLAPHLLTTVLHNCRQLFLSLGHSIHRNEVLDLGELDRHKQIMPMILGLLLFKLGSRKEGYMNDSPYLVGRMLKLADELHALYCKEVRDGRLPPQLLGNALMAAALDSPTQALAQLALRIPTYLGWAKTNSTASVGLSRYFLKEFAIIESKLRDASMPVRLGDTEKAQLLLGYISGNPQ